tara:strand:+ start:2323 stop:2688 length:366 start_codon:yes stop_codon:yes gene_type:complete
METSYKYWTWSNGSKLEKTQKNNKQQSSVGNKNEINNYIEEISTEKKELDKINKFVEFDQIIVEPNNKRSETNERMSTRHMIIQKPINPFLKDSDYLNDINVQDTLLRPKDSNFKNSYIDK